MADTAVVSEEQKEAWLAELCNALSSHPDPEVLIENLQRRGILGEEVGAETKKESQQCPST